MLRSFVLKISSHGSLFYTADVAQTYASSCEYYALRADVYNSCFMVWIRVDAMWRAYTYGKIGELRPQTCTYVCRFKIARSFHCRVTQSKLNGVARMYVTKLYVILRNPWENSTSIRHSSLSRYRFRATNLPLIWQEGKKLVRQFARTWNCDDRFTFLFENCYIDVWNFYS